MFKRALLSAMALVVLCPPAALALEVNRERLPNGLLVLHSERDNLPLVVLTLVVKAGVLEEPAEKAGLANLTAKLLSEGTKSRSSVRLNEEVEFIGARLGASAGRDYTTINLSVLKKDVEKGFELFADILLNPVFPKEELERKKRIVKGSLRKSEENPSFLASRAFIKEVYGDHPYGRVLRGSFRTLEGITREDILGFYSGYFHPNNSILTVVGDLDRGELVDLIDRHLKGWQEATVLALPKVPIRKAVRKVVRIDKDLTQANIMLGHIGVRRDNPDYYALSIMNFILGGGGFSSRLMDSIRDRMGLAYSVYSSFSPRLEQGHFMVSVQTKNASANTVVDEVLGEMKRIREEGVTEEELDDAKAYLTGSFPRRLDTMGKLVGFLSSVEFYGLGPDYVEKYPGYINAVSREDVMRVAQKYLDTEDFILAVVAKQSEANIRNFNVPTDQPADP
jgi:zinc protease